MTMDPPVSRRAHRRWPVRLDAEVTVSGGGALAEIQNISLGGAFLVCDAALSPGAGLRLAFRLPNGVPLTVTARVVHVERSSESSPFGVGIEFYGLDGVTREMLRSYFASKERESSGSEETISTRFEEKFRVETDHKERVYVLLSGFLDKWECEKLTRAVNDTLGLLTGGGVRLCIDATRYQCCTPDSVEQFKKCFSLLTKRSWYAAALVGPKSVGMMQMRRAARDANVADCFARFDEIHEALEFLELVGA